MVTQRLYKKIQFTLALFLAVLFIVSFVGQAKAASFEFYPAVVSYPRGGDFSASVLLNTQDENINTVGGEVVLAEGSPQPKSINVSGSIISHWIEYPHFNADAKTITFSGSVPGGYKGSNAILFSIVFTDYRGEALDNAATLRNVVAYKNDGLGSVAVPNILNSFSFGNKPSERNQAVEDQLYINDTKNDNIPPESFTPQVAKDATIFEGKWFISFLTTDKQSGVDHYEVQESRTGVIDSAGWKDAVSPYILQDQSLTSYIYVLAIDKQGNERIIKVFPRNAVVAWKQYVELGIIIVLILIAGFSWQHYQKTKLRKQNEASKL